MRAVRLAVVVAVAAAPTWAAPAAFAVTPPPVDETRLPPAGPPGPPQPTTRFDDCVAIVRMPLHPPEGSGQFAGWDLPAVWALTSGAGQTVAVIDTGVARHPRLPHLVAGGDYVSNGDGTSDCDGHGTTIAAIIGAAPDVTGDPVGIGGIAPQASILAIRQSSNKFRASDDPAGSGYGDVETMAAAVRAAADLGATVVNISSVACVPSDIGLDDRALGAALAYAVDVKNVVVVTAAGNTDSSGPCPGRNSLDSGGRDDVAVVASPAWYDDYVLTVGSVGRDGSASTFSLEGPWVDVAAPGEVDMSSTVDDDVVEVAGTNYAAPVVSAVAALVRSRFPELTARQVMRRIEDTALPSGAGWNAATGHGVVDPLAAVSGGSPPRPAPSSPRPVGSAATPPAPDPAPGRAAIRAAVACLAVGAAVAALSAGRLRRRPDSVPGD